MLYYKVYVISRNIICYLVLFLSLSCYEIIEFPNALRQTVLININKCANYENNVSHIPIIQSMYES